jgi:predicted metal-dependent phosphoesterase TrpH
MMISPYKADLHMHTTCSDGKYTPTELVHKAKNYGLSCISITDHDTMSGIDEAQMAAQGLGIEVIPGVEVSSSFNDKETHILCYGVDKNNKTWKSILESQRGLRRERATEMVNRINGMGYPVSIDDVAGFADLDVVTRPHIAQALVQVGYASDTRDAFSRFIGNDCPGYVPMKLVDVFELIDAAHQAGGLAVLAHPGTQFSTEQIMTLIEAGLDGLEYLHPSQGYYLQQKFKELAHQHKLLATAGSDFHGFRFQDFSYFGTIYVGMNTISDLKERCKTIKSAFLAIES